jgi:hypothetical protein
VVFLAGREDEGHFDEELLSVLPDLGLVPEDVPEEGQSRAQEQVELNLTLVEQGGLGQLRDVETPAQHEILRFFHTCRGLCKFYTVF